VPRYYLDTSAQVERNGGYLRNEFSAKLTGQQHSTSLLVEREWNRIVYEVAVALYEALAESETRLDVVNRMRRAWGTRGVSRNWQVTEWIMGGEEDLRIVEQRLDEFVRIRARVMFHASVDTVRRGTACGVVERRPHSEKGHWKYNAMCKKKDVICTQPEFLTGEIARARAAAEALEGSERDGDREMGAKATKALRDTSGDGTKGNECHARNGLGGDICIALECAADEVLLTTDHSFDLICPAISRNHERVPYA
jgi:hypothetical protein